MTGRHRPVATARTLMAAASLCLVWSTAGAQVARPAQASTSVEDAQRVRPPSRPVTPPRPTVSPRRQPGRPGSLELSAGAAWLGPSSLGSSQAQLTSNGSSTPFTYFTAAGRMEGAPSFDARLTYNLTRRLAIEGGFVAARPSITFTISNDAENPVAPSGSAEKMSQYFADGNLLVFLPSLTFGQGRGRAFLAGGAGYLRQLHAGNYQVETGVVYNGGGGIKYYFARRPKGILKALGLRVDLRAYYKSGGFSFDSRNTWTVSLGGGAVLAF